MPVGTCVLMRSREFTRGKFREQREPYFRKIVLSLCLSSKKGILRVILDVSEMEFWRVENTFRWGDVFLVEERYHGQCMSVPCVTPCLDTTDGKHVYNTSYLRTNTRIKLHLSLFVLQRVQISWLKNERENYFFFPVFTAAGTLTIRVCRWLQESHRRVQTLHKV